MGTSHLCLAHSRRFPVFAFFDNGGMCKRHFPLDAKLAINELLKYKRVAIRVECSHITIGIFQEPGVPRRIRFVGHLFPRPYGLFYGRCDTNECKGEFSKGGIRKGFCRSVGVFFMRTTCSFDVCSFLC